MDHNNDDDCAPPLMILDYRSARQEVGMNSASKLVKFGHHVISLGRVVRRRARHFRSIFVRFSAKLLDGQQQKIHTTPVGCSWMEAEIREEIQA